MCCTVKVFCKSFHLCFLIYAKMTVLDTHQTVWTSQESHIRNTLIYLFVCFFHVQNFKTGNNASRMCIIENNEIKSQVK